MPTLSHNTIKDDVAQSGVIYSRGEKIFSLGNYSLVDQDTESGSYTYNFDGSYGEYEVLVRFEKESVSGSCTCPYPYSGCKHVVAACLDIAERQRRAETTKETSEGSDEHLTPEEIKKIALESRKERAKHEEFTLIPGETYKGPHTVRNARGKEYTVTVYEPAKGTGHCSCPDYATNQLETCKHLIFVYDCFSKEDGFLHQTEKELFPFVHLTWNARLETPVCHYERVDDEDVREAVEKLFNDKGVYTRKSINALYELYSQYSDTAEELRFDEHLLNRMNELLYQKEIKQLAKQHPLDFSFLKTPLYSYQEEGVRFAVFRRAAIIADEMGLGKTLQAITTGLLKRQIFGFQKILVVSPSSLKSQWKQEIEKYTDASAHIVSGGRDRRRRAYEEGEALFMITNYEALMRDVLTVSRWRPDFVILDEAQRIKNYATKTHHAVRSIPHEHSLVITGTPLENRLEDLYSIVQFSEPHLLTPLWAFAAHHLDLSSSRKNKVLGYRNLNAVHEKISPLLLRRKKADVIENLPEKIENNYYIDLSREQEEIHQGYMASLFSIISKRVITPMDVKRMQKILLSMRMACDSTYLIDKKTNISPKLVELVSILKELVLENGRKVVIFSEWTNMTYLIGKALSELGIDFVEFTGKIPTEKRQALIDEFRGNPDCMVFLSSDAGGVGLNLQNTDCLINFELPWNPAKLNQRIGRVHRIGQQSSAVNVINLITKNSIEERVYAGINLKQELFDAAVEGAGDNVDMSRENKNRFINRVRSLFNEEELENGPEAYGREQKQAELDEETPHYLNPEVLQQQEPEVDISAEEFSDDENRIENDKSEKGRAERDESGERAAASWEEMETVLNQGMDFLNSLSKMTTGKPLAEGESEKSVEIDRETGEVVMRFKLPGF
jgi:ERCC4-related helicase